MKTLNWFDRIFTFGLPKEMLPFYLERLEGSVFRIEAKVKGVSDNVLSEKYNGKWSIKENIGHLAEIDVISNRRIDEMKSGAEVLSPAVFEPKDYNPWPIEKVVAFFREARQSNLDKYKSISETDLLKASTHPRLKVKMTPIDLAFFDAEHDDHHILKISEIIKEHQ
ncbi:MAG TPA: DinB family protein [Cyclobacteriaceae bacterium]|nr:DinB family protein [Cyclobacteriaceae bacterium]